MLSSHLWGLFWALWSKIYGYFGQFLTIRDNFLGPLLPILRLTFLETLCNFRQFGFKKNDGYFFRLDGSSGPMCGPFHLEKRKGRALWARWGQLGPGLTCRSPVLCKIHGSSILYTEEHWTQNSEEGLGVVAMRGQLGPVANILCSLRWVSFFWMLSNLHVALRVVEIIFSLVALTRADEVNLDRL